MIFTLLFFQIVRIYILVASYSLQIVYISVKVNEFVAVIKNSSMGYVLGIAELTFSAKVVQGATYKGLEPLLISAFFYLILTFSLGRLVGWAERRMKASDSH